MDVVINSATQFCVLYGQRLGSGHVLNEFEHEAYEQAARMASCYFKGLRMTFEEDNQKREGLDGEGTGVTAQ